MLPDTSSALAANMLNKGTKLDPRSLTASELAPTISIEVGKRVRSTPFGENYLGTQGSNKLLLTSFEPELVAAPEARARLAKSLETASSFRHACVLNTYGSIQVSGTLIAVRAHPGFPALRNFIDRRQSRGKELSLATAIGIIIEIAHALCALHPSRTHGFLNSETVFLSKTGTAILGGLGEMPVLREAPVFREAYASGVLPMPPPELRGGSPKPSPASDIFFVGSLFVELLTGKCVTAAGDDMRSLRERVPPALRDIFVSCCAAQASSRPADAFEFLDMLAKFQAGSEPEPMVSKVAGAPAIAIQDPPSADAFLNLGALASLDEKADSSATSVPTMTAALTIDSLTANSSIGISVPTLQSPVPDDAGPGMSAIGLGELREGISLSNLGSSPTISVTGSGAPGIGISLDIIDDDLRLVVVVSGIDEGPYDLDTIRSKIRSGTIKPTNLVGELGASPQKASTHPAIMNMFATAPDGAVALVSMSPLDGPGLPVPSEPAKNAREADHHTDAIMLDFSGDSAAPRSPSAPMIASTGGPTPELSRGQAEENAGTSSDFTPTPAPANRLRKNRGTSAAGTFGWILVSLFIFALTAWVMWQRQGSGG